MRSHPRPHWFLVRPDNTITPLIAVDELPPDVHIAGVPAVMSLVDTKSMESVGVRERSTGAYVIELAGSSSNTNNSEEQRRTSDKSESDSVSKKSAAASNSVSVQGPRNKMEDMPIEPQSNERVQFPDLHGSQQSQQSTETTAKGNLAVEAQSGKSAQSPDLDGCQDSLQSTETTSSHLKAEETVRVEKWRQDVGTPNETQAKIDALLAANQSVGEEAKIMTKDENPRAVRAKAGLVPGKKVYCSHWIRNGDCDFTQQGCLYKHEMPDNDTLRAIGIRAMPSWYIAAHPAKARERGWGTGKAPPASFQPGRPLTGAGPAPNFGPVRMPQQSRPPSFQPSQFLGSPESNGSSSFHPSASSPNPRIQELTDQQYQQWQQSSRVRPNELQVVRKPYRSPGYNTCPFPAPAPAPIGIPVTSQTEPEPVWLPRQSKFTKGPPGSEDDPTANPRRNEAEIYEMKPADTKVGSLDHAGFVPLKPSSRPEPQLPGPTTRQRKLSLSSDLFDLAPTVIPPAPRSLFSRTGREDRVPTPTLPEPVGKDRSLGRNEVKKFGRYDEPTRSNVGQIPAQKKHIKPERREDVTGDNDRKSTRNAPDGMPKVKRAVKDHGSPSELLLDYGM
ncbi:MAG: hypothetical protein Q9182_002394 [Xanthomendoza sp. 2 TL-2023]